MEREGDPLLAAAPYKVRPDETINSIRQKRAPGTPVHTKGTLCRRIIRHQGTACALIPLSQVASENAE
ncbi:hypothetical protein ALC56_01733 [Trachymyrmex septentrionalis]|uniref:Uncharacterized protein n=1 Tax=Trachymyrmex septentrionalis TaxID=34720 RepID=A0A195FTS3_9HYME|nr:hypothetical protein ALC56_01733 [Trachymyrmex septentrionalis]